MTKTNGLFKVSKVEDTIATAQSKKITKRISLCHRLKTIKGSAEKDHKIKKMYLNLKALNSISVNHR